MAKKPTLLLLFFIGATELPAQVYTYEWIEGGPPDTLEWVLRPIDHNRYEILSYDTAGDTSQWMLCDESYYTLEWFYKDKSKGKRFRGYLEGDTITIRGEGNQKSIYEKIPTSGLPWIQFHCFALSNFVGSNRQQLKFLSISPNSFRAGKLVAGRHDVEEVRLNHHVEKGVHVKVHLAGLLYYLGWVNFWFRDSDHAFIYFKGKTDVFGPVTYCTLVDIRGLSAESKTMSGGLIDFGSPAE